MLHVINVRILMNPHTLEINSQIYQVKLIHAQEAISIFHFDISSKTEHGRGNKKKISFRKLIEFYGFSLFILF